MKDRIKDRIVKAKEWTKDHSFEIFIYGGSAAAVVLSVVAAQQANKAEANRQQAVADFYVKALEEDKFVLPGPDGVLWMVDRTH